MAVSCRINGKMPPWPVLRPESGPCSVGTSLKEGIRSGDLGVLQSGVSSGTLTQLVFGATNRYLLEDRSLNGTCFFSGVSEQGLDLGWD